MEKAPHRSKVMPVHNQFPLQLIVEVILRHAVESFIEYIYRCSHIRINILSIMVIN